jgi:hypothetical protein
MAGEWTFGRLPKRCANVSRWASRTRSSPPTSAVSDTDFGAENAASHPARCSALVLPLDVVDSKMVSAVGIELTTY